MSHKRSRRLPVISRLTLAWTALAAAAAGVCGYAAVWGANALRPEKIALPLGEVETLARAEPVPPIMKSVLDPRTTSERLQPAVAPDAEEGDMLREPSFDEAEDALHLDATPAAPTDEDALDIVITVDGEPARAPGARVIEPKLATLTAFKRASSIPDPEPALLQSSALGKIPRIASDGRRAMKFYAARFDDMDDVPKVSLVVGGLGLNPELTARAIEELPPYVTLAFAPYAKDLDRWTAEARAAGHEIMVELPMEGYGGNVDALGPAALLTTRTEAENQQRLDWLLSRFGGFIGATNYIGGKFSADRKSLTAVIARLNALGLAYVDDTGAAGKAAEGAANWAAVNRTLATKGASADAGDVARELAALEKLALDKGDALGKTYAFDATISAIADWAQTLEERGVALAPASAILQARAAKG